MIAYDDRTNVCVLSGEFRFSNAMECLTAFEDLKLKLHTHITLDCSKITKADSSFLAILIEIRCWTHRQRWPFTIKQLPPFLKNFLSVYGIESLLTTPLMDTKMSDASFSIV